MSKQSCLDEQVSILSREETSVKRNLVKGGRPDRGGSLGCNRAGHSSQPRPPFRERSFGPAWMLLA